MFSFTNPKCCFIIPSRYGVILMLTIWIGISMYFSVQAFRGISPFFSHFNPTALIVFGVIHLVFVVLCLFGYTLHWFKRSISRYHRYANLFACSVAIVLLDTLINCILFSVNKHEFIDWCISSTTLPIRIQQPDVWFNCHRLFDAEAKFAFTSLVLMILIYVYWVSVIIIDSRNFVMMGPEMSIRPPRRDMTLSQPDQHPTIILA